MSQRKLRQSREFVRALARRLPGRARLHLEEVVSRLQTAPLFIHFDTLTLEALAAGAEELTLQAGEYVFRKGDSSDEVYLLVRGAACVLLEEGSQETVVVELRDGTVFGELAMLAGERRSASIRATEPSTLVRLSRAALMARMEANDSLRWKVWRTFAERRFDDMARELGRYRWLSRQERQEWLQRSRHRELSANEAFSPEPGTSVFVISGEVELEREELWMTARGSMVLESTQPMRVVARERTQLLLLPRRAGASSGESSASAPREVLGGGGDDSVPQPPEARQVMDCLAR
jgi:CRP-like cAMP-binding protein